MIWRKANKYFNNYLEREFAIKKIDCQVLKQALQMVLDVSINEYSVKQLGSSKLPLNVFYPKLEEKIMRISKPFLDTLFRQSTPDAFKAISQLYMDNLRKIFIKRSERRLHNLVYATICINTENKIKKLYIEFSINQYESKNHISEDEDESCEDRESSPEVKEPRVTKPKPKSSFAKLLENDKEPVLLPARKSTSKEEKIVEFVQNIIKKPYLNKNRNSSLLRNKTHNQLLFISGGDEEEEEKDMEDRYNKNTKNLSESSESDLDDIEDEPKINLLRCNRSSLNPFMAKREKMLMTPKETDKNSVNEKELSLAFYQYAMKNHKKLFDNLRTCYQQWREGITKFNTSDDKVGVSSIVRKTYGKQLGPILADSLQLIRHHTQKDSIYDESEPKFDDTYYENFNEGDIELRDFLMDDQGQEDSDFDLDSDFGDWL